MDNVLADTLKANLRNAATEDAKLDALVLAMIAVVDCQLKTAERVKAIVEERKRDQEAWQEERRREYEANRKKEEEEVN